MPALRSLGVRILAAACAAALLLPVAPLAADDGAKIAEEAKALLPTVEKLRGLKFKNEVTVGVQNKEELRKKLIQDFEKELPRDKARKFQKALEKFGFMKPGGDLWQIILDLLSDQIAGFYDPESKALYLIAEHRSADEDGEEETGGADPDAMMAQMLGMDQNRLVTVHELVHALQDQNFDLLTLPMGVEDNDDLITAVKAVVEGEATFVMFDDVTQKMGIGLENMPGLDRMLEAGGAMPQSPGADALGEAPEYLKRNLVFSYMGGLGFVQAVKKARGWKGVNALYEDMPASSEQILHPEKYLDQRDHPTLVTLPDFGPDLGKDWTHLWTNNWGELNLEILFKEFFPTSKTSSVTHGWDGDQYRVYEGPGGRLLSVWLTVWDSEKDAEQFVTAYKKLIGKKYGVETPAEKSSLYEWQHDGQEIILERRGAEVLVVEGAPTAALAKLAERSWAESIRKELTKVLRTPPPDKAEKTATPLERAPKATSPAGTSKSQGKRNPKTSTLKGSGWEIETTLPFDCCTYREAHGRGESSCSDCASVFRVTSFHAHEGETVADALTEARRRLTGMVEGMEVLQQRAVKVDGRVGSRVLLKGVPPEVGAELTLDLVVVQGKGRFFVFLDAAPSSDYDICKAAFQEWVKSAKIRE